MSTFAIKPGFHHVALRVRDFDKSMKLYTEAFGFTPRVAWGEPGKRAVIMTMGNGAHLELFERPDQAPATGEGVLLHICLASDDIDGCAAAARELGLTVTVEPKNVDIPDTLSGKPVPVRLCFVKGFDGEVIEFFQER